MNQADDPEKKPDTLDEYDFDGGVRGKYAAAYHQGSNVVVLDPDVAEVFTDAASVNAALRVLADLVRQQTQTVSDQRV
jgi:hypothetical protein